MNLSFADTLYFKKENTLEIILGLHRSYKSLQREIQICCELNNLTFNELIAVSYTHLTLPTILLV